MLVIISDLHLTDGTSGSTISPGAFALLAERLADLSLSASQRRDGSYRPIEHVDLVLLGDTIDAIRSTQWLRGAIRPWDDVKSPALFEQVAKVTSDVLQHNSKALSEFRKLQQRGIVIPPATSAGQMAASAGEVQPVPVRIHYMVGNHDWFYHLPGENYNQLRRLVAAHLGLSTYADAPFPHEIWESNELVQVMRRHKVFARHGDVYDPFNYEGDRDASSLGDVIVLELLNRFGVQVMQQLGDDLPTSALVGLREIDNIRPLLLIPVWIEGLLERCCPQPAIRNEVKKIWDELADEFLEHPFVQHRDTWCPIDIVDGLQKALKFSRRLSVGWASWIAQWIADLRGASSQSYYQHALTEQDFRNRRARHIVYGHTHHAEMVPLDASYADGYVLHQGYFNSGTWRRVHTQTQFAPREHEFIAADTMTYLAFFKDDERGGRPYETWTGTLGLPPITTPKFRVDQAEAKNSPATEHQAHVSSQPLSTPSVPIRAPTSPYHLLPAVSSVDPQSAEFGEQMAAAGSCFGRAQVAAILCVHGTFVGNDALGLLTELSRCAPGLSQTLSRCGKRMVDLVTGEAGNYTDEFTDAMETCLAVGAERTIPVRQFHWSGQNNHIARADGAIRLIAKLARLALELASAREDALTVDTAERATVDVETTDPQRILMWAHSHGGNVLALATQLLGVDLDARDEFFTSASPFYQPWLRQAVDMPVWQQVRDLLADASHPVHQLALDLVTFGTPIRYGWNAKGYAKLLHFVHHRPPQRGAEYSAPVPLELLRARKGLDGDYIQQIGIAGTNLIPPPLAVRTLLADWRLDRYLEHDVANESILTRLRHGVRVPDEGTTLLVDYRGIHPRVYRNLAGHALYTRRKWLPFHCHEIAERFYGDFSEGDRQEMS